MNNRKNGKKRVKQNVVSKHKRKYTRKKKDEQVKNSAFTLIEILAVIVIIGVIGLIGVSSISNTTEKARKESFATSAKTLV